GLLGRLAHRAATGDLEGHGARVDVVVGTVEQGDREIDDREADEVTALGLLAHALLDRRDVLARDVAALDLVVEDDALAALARRDAHLGAAELAGAARLLLVRVVDLDLAGEALAVRHLRGADVSLDLELALHAVDQDVEVKLTHPLDDRLAGFVIR